MRVLPALPLLVVGACASAPRSLPSGGGGAAAGGAPTASSLAPTSRELAGEDLPDGARTRFGTVRLRWHGVPEALIFTPDGAKLVGVSLDRALRVWDARSGRRLHLLRGHGGHILAGAVSPDSRWLASCAYDDRVIVWELATGRQVRALTGLDHPRALAFSPDGRRLAVSLEGAVVVFETAGWTETLRRPYSDLTVKTLRFTADGRLLAPDPGAAGLTDLLAPGASVVALQDLPRDGGPAAFSHDGRWLAGGDGLSIHLYDVATGARRSTLPSPVQPARGWPAGYQQIVFSPDDRTLAVGSSDTGTWLLPVDGSAPRPISDRGIFALGWSPDGGVLATDGLSPSVRLWRVGDGARLDHLPAHDDELEDLALSADGRTLVTAGEDETVRVWDATTGELRRTIATTGRTPYAVAASPDGRRVYVGLDTPVVRVHDAGSGALLVEREVLPGGFVSALAVHASGVVLVALSDGVAFLDAETLAPRQGDGYFNGFSLSAGGFAPDGRTIAMTGGGQLLLFDRDRGRSFAKEPRAIGTWTYALAWTPDGAHILLAGNDGKLELVPVAGGEPVLVLRQPAPIDDDLGLLRASAAAFSPDGRLLATAGFDGRITIWELAGGAIVRTLVGHEDTVDALVFAPDSKTLYSASRDSTALAWPL